MMQKVDKGVLAAMLVSCLAMADAGTKCPAGSDLDPWICTTLPFPPGQQFTILSCQGVFCQYSNGSRARSPPERGIYDRVFLSKIDNLVLPDGWLELVRVRELFILDSVLSNDFLNETALLGQQDFMTSLSVCNSRLTAPLCTKKCTPPTEKQVYVSHRGRYEKAWIPSKDTRMNGLSHLNNLRYLDLSHNLITNLTSDSFPKTLLHLDTINLSYNQMDIIDTGTLAFMPSLSDVNLSHNRLKTIAREVFQMEDTHLNVLDLSWNRIASLPEDVFVGMEELKRVDVSNNLLQNLHTNTWKHLTGTLTWLDIEGNFLVCDCSMSWINDLPATSDIHGTCVSPMVLDESDIRRLPISLLCPLNETSVIHTTNNNSDVNFNVAQQRHGKYFPRA